MIKFYDWLLLLFKPVIIVLGKIGLPKRKITGKTYFQIRDEIEPGTVLLTKTNWEFSNLVNPTNLKHAAIYVGLMGEGKVRYVAEAVGEGVKLTDLVTFLTTKDTVVLCKPKFIRDKQIFHDELRLWVAKVVGLPYDYLFNKDGKAFYCFELAAASLIGVYSDLNLKCKEIVKGKRIYDENTFLDINFFNVVYDSRIENEK